MSSDSPEDVVDRQIAAYNDGDVDAFASQYAADAVVAELGADEPMATGREEIREHYGELFEEVSPSVEICSRMTLGALVVDHERLELADGESVEAIGVYRVADDAIERLWLAHE